LLNLALQQVLLALPRAGTGLEQGAFRREQRLDRLVGRARRKLRRSFELRKTIAFGGQPRDLRTHFVKLLAHHLLAGLSLGRVNTHREIAGSNMAAVLHLDLGDDAAGRVLDRLYVGLNDEISGNDDRARERHQKEPAAADYAGNKENAKPGTQLALE